MGVPLPLSSLTVRVKRPDRNQLRCITRLWVPASAGTTKLRFGLHSRWDGREAMQMTGERLHQAFFRKTVIPILLKVSPLRSW